MKRPSNSRGFTLVELMIATTVFSVVLLIVSVGLIQIGRAYYKNITSSRTQEAARSVIDDISGSSQLSESPPRISGDGVATPGAVCLGTDRYTYRIDDPISAPGEHALYADKISASAECTPVNLASPPEGRELLSENMRLLHFSVTPMGGLTNVHIKVGYGDSDLLTHYHENGTRNLAVSPSDAQCRSSSQGGTFCAVSELETIVKRRIIR